MNTSYALRELRPVQISRRGSALRFLAITAGASAVFSAGLLLPHPSAAEYRQTCPSGSALRTFEDGSGACYAPGSVRPVRHADGTPVQWRENTFPWDCRTDGNGRCGDSVDVDACAPVGSADAATDGCPVWRQK